MSNSARFRAFSKTLFSKTAWLATVALVATLLVASPVSQTAAVATEAAIAPSSISVGAYHSCAVVDGGVKCWGYNGDGQLGVDGIEASATAVQAIAPESGVWQVSAGGDHSCALFEDGAIKCWGNNYSGELGNGTWADSYQPSNVLITADDVETVGVDETVELTGATQISAGDSHTCALVNGGVKCWGENGSYGQLGVDSDHQNTAVDVLEGRDPLAGATQVSAGYQHTCAVVDAGVMCWGRNNHGQRGSGTISNSSNMSELIFDTDGETVIGSTFLAGPVSVVDEAGDLTGVIQVSAGVGFSCAVLAAGSVKCWGYNDDGQLGDGTFDNSGTALVVASVANATQVSAGDGHVCAIVAGGVKCWGANWDGQLGNGTETDSSSAVEAIAAGAGVIAVGAGDGYSCALLANEIKCWGGNWDGQLGNGDVLSQEAPVAVTGLQGATKLAAGDEFSCAIVANGEVKCWGNNWNGQLGDGTKTDSSTPVLVTGLSGATAITAGDSHVCALLSDGGVKCWGDNNGYQLGNGLDTDSITPVSVLTSTGVALTGVTKISAGSNHTCAIVAGSVKCWGYNNYWGQIDASGVDREFASPVSGLPSETAVDITANYYTTCVVVDEGVVCLGAGLGSSSGPPRELHLEIENSSATAASLGDGVLCALVANGQVTCLGANRYGQTGVAPPVDYNSDIDDLSSAQAIDGLAGQVIIDAGDSHVCALSDAGAVSCWGSNHFGELGRSIVGVSTHIPAVVTGLGSGVTDLTVGEQEHSCAIVSGVVKCWGSNSDGALGLARTGNSVTPITSSGVFGIASVVAPTVIQSVIYARPELAKFDQLAISKSGQQITLKGKNLDNIQFVFFGSKEAKVLSVSDAAIALEVPANLWGFPQITLVTKAGVQTLDGQVRIVQPYAARTLKVSSFNGNALTKAASVSIRKSYLQDSSVNMVSCTAVVAKGASAKVKAATIAKSRSACKAVSGYSVKFREFKVSVKTLNSATAKPFVSVTFDRSTPVLVRTASN